MSYELTVSLNAGNAEVVECYTTDFAAIVGMVSLAWEDTDRDSLLATTWHVWDGEKEVIRGYYANGLSDAPILHVKHVNGNYDHFQIESNPKVYRAWRMAQ